MWRRFRKSAEVNSPKLPAGSRVYAIGDVHGRADLLQETDYLRASSFRLRVFSRAR